ncbi:AraC family transcriptional regulator [Algoriphagus lacus]|uniref:AraC family transcriptional regulator n=1 Tax=Algoriphagus lacus TaxID=2056311 RepID=A0A418PNX5_9BACT|nr:AraC family transcriptional regulator [Algoriphagus lacus]RIW13431.1 AraC family transcriptional regulator [Algoriphagus lacus]
MTVEEFNIDKGLYVFEFEGFETEFHSHPAIEVVIAKNGDFSLWTDTETHENLKFAVVSANQRHKLSSTNCALKIIMIEHHNRLVIDHLKLADIDLSNGYFIQSEPYNEAIQIDNLVQIIRSGKELTEYDFRISKAIEYLDQNDLEYDSMIKTLRAVTKLSESRLSHLFKSNIGISLKKYLIWSRLKSTIKNHLDSEEGLFSALIKSGFYDQPHFSKSFKSMLGVKPSRAYNSRSLQVLSKSGL